MVTTTDIQDTKARQNTTLKALFASVQSCQSGGDGGIRIELNIPHLRGIYYPLFIALIQRLSALSC